MIWSYFPKLFDSHFTLPYGLVVLNRCQKRCFDRFAQHATLTFCADGGAEMARSVNIPVHAVVGDFDSACKNANTGATKVMVENQNCHDFEKLLHYYCQVMHENVLPLHPLIVAGAFGGRLDHTLANIFCALKYPFVELYLCDEENVAMVLSPQSPPHNQTPVAQSLHRPDHIFSLPPSSQGLKCGIFPMFGPVSYLHTTGLKWNLDGPLRAPPPGRQDSAPGECDSSSFFSSSNELQGPTLAFSLSAPVLFTVAAWPRE
eukprot:GCRY01002310.1.p1 GENE.GCRY01002310.1~~GCRY01002310.1.p1  ORF type:complete len:260 (-),score=44.18 GCRY01002310.1:395-1174(-)